MSKLSIIRSFIVIAFLFLQIQATDETEPKSIHVRRKLAEESKVVSDQDSTIMGHDNVDTTRTLEEEDDEYYSSISYSYGYGSPSSEDYDYGSVDDYYYKGSVDDYYYKGYGYDPKKGYGYTR